MGIFSTSRMDYPTEAPAKVDCSVSSGFQAAIPAAMKFQAAMKDLFRLQWHDWKPRRSPGESREAYLQRKRDAYRIFRSVKNRQNERVRKMNRHQKRFEHSSRRVWGAQTVHLVDCPKMVAAAYAMGVTV